MRKYLKESIENVQRRIYRRQTEMKSFNAYLNFNGETEEAFNFYRSVFGGDFLLKQTMKDSPDGKELPEEEQNRIMHVSLQLGEGMVLMGSDILPSMGHKLTKGNNCYISLNAESKEEAERLFEGLSAGGKVEMPLTDMFWGSYWGSFSDKFGVQWMIDFAEEQR
jgi:PhnB protein